MSNLTVWLVVGCATGWLISVVMRARTQSAVVFNIVIGTVGAIIGSSGFSALMGTAAGNQNDFNISAVFTSFLGAAVLLAAVFYFRRPAAR